MTDDLTAATRRNLVLLAAGMAALALFGVGLGWSLSFVAATAELSERACSESGRR